MNIEDRPKIDPCGTPEVTYFNIRKMITKVNVLCAM